MSRGREAEAGGHGHSHAAPAVERIAALASERSLTLACAESLTAGAIASALARGEDAASWFAGGVVSYMSEVKFEVLGVTEGPVVTASCAQEMVRGVAALLGADAAVAVTGVGGPDEEEGQPAGTVFVATCVHGRTEVTHHRFEGDPLDVLDQTVAVAIDQLQAGLVATPGP
ncbi:MULTISPECIES: CinA family protein [unclassified Nocardioides]|uniref:CinA family protein n=1 Tax=unclassified Nocardioides TaxID=2615069 RepID=UPI00117402D5|nr:MULTISPECIES: CinA family protein [unclassified Nocardioides]TQK70277.1 nicotinamide-nucleotide amidase [Nocardioides sp. SLBN-35]WGY00321.1 CinA family protein [Nocardioides sp. QY071]